MSKRIPFLVAVLLNSACSLIPEHATTKADLANHWPAEVAAYVPVAAKVSPGGTASPVGTAPAPTASVLPPMTESSWQQFFAEPALQKTIAAALASSRDLAAALARLEQARAEAGAVLADRWPHVEAVAQRNASHIPPTVKGSNSGTTIQRYDVNLTTTYEVDFWDRVSSLDEAAKATFLASDFAHQAFRLTLIGDVATAWFALEELQQRERLLTLMESTRKASLDLLGQRREVGLTNDVDYLAADAALHSARAELGSTSRQRAAAENALRAMLGRELTDDLRPPLPTSDKVQPLTVFPPVAIGLPAEAILRRPDVRAAEQRLLAAEANIGAARAAFLPRIVLTATAGTASTALTNLFTAGSRAWLFTPALHLPIFNAGRNDANLDIAKARANALVADYERTLQLAFRDIADILAIGRFGGQQVREIFLTSEAQIARVALLEARYNAGIVNRLDLLDAQRESINAQLAQHAARRQTNAAGALFFKSVGGI